MEHRSYKFRLYPTEEQKTLMLKTFGCVRFVWNRMIAEAKEAYETTGKLRLTSPAIYKRKFEWLKEVDSLALCGAWSSEQEERG